MASKFAESVLNVLLQVGCKLKTKPKTIAKLEEPLQVVCSNLPYAPIDKVVKDFSN